MISSNQANDLPPENRAIDHLLAAHADALTRKPHVQPEDFDFLFDEYGLDEVETAEAESLFQIAHRLNDLPEVAPSEEFVARLQNDLTGARIAESALILRWRRLPTIYRLAASVGGMTITAGILLLAGRRLVDVITLRRRQQDKDGLSLNTIS